MIPKSKLAGIKRLLQKKYRDEEEKFIVEGAKSVDEAITASADIEAIICDEKRILDTKFISKLKKSSKEYFSVSSKEVEFISDAVTSQGIVAVIRKSSSLSYLASLLTGTSALIVAVEEINDPGNLGTIIRTCDWFNVDALVISKSSVELHNPKVVRATMGSIFHFPIIDNTDLISFLKKSKHDNFSIYSAELNNNDVTKIRWDQKSIIIIGSESHGVSAEVSRFADHKITIPQFGKAESLNAAIACGIILAQIKLR